MGIDVVLDAVVRAAVEGTGAARGWIVVPDGDRLLVRASVGDDAAHLVDAEVARRGLAALVVASGSPMAISPRGDDPTAREGVVALVGIRPVAVCCVPLIADEVRGALELVDKADGTTFTFDDLEIATLLAQVGAAALASPREGLDVPSPDSLRTGLEQLASSDPSRYRVVAGVVETLLAYE